MASKRHSMRKTPVTRLRVKELDGDAAITIHYHRIFPVCCQEVNFIINHETVTIGPFNKTSRNSFSSTSAYHNPPKSLSPLPNEAKPL